MAINCELYKAFYSVATTLSFTKAAKELSMTPSSVSQAVKILESNLNQTLFLRNTKRVTLTPEGELLLRYIEPAIELIKCGEDKLSEAKRQSGRICVAANDTICRYMLIPYIEKFHKEYPTAEINVISATSVQCAELLKNGQVDMILSNFPNIHLGGYAEVQELQSFQDVLVMNEKYRELINETLDLSQLLTYPILMLDKDTTTSEFLHSIFRQAQLELVPEVEVSSNDLLLDLARIGLGIAFIPDYCITADNAKGLYTVDTQAVLPKRKMILAYNRKLFVSKALREFLKYFETYNAEK